MWTCGDIPCSYQTRSVDVPCDPCRFTGIVTHLSSCLVIA
jgi:hypothetical protein